MTPCTPGMHFLQYLKFAGFTVFINETLYLTQKNLTLGPVLSQFLSDGAQISYAYGPLHVDSESFCLEQPVLNVEVALITFLYSHDTTRRAGNPNLKVAFVDLDGFFRISDRGIYGC